MTNNFFNHRVLWLLIPLLTLFNLSAWGADYTITFGNSAGSATALSESVNASTAISAGTSYVTSKPFTVNSGKCYYGDNTSCIRVGKSGENAELAIALSSSGQVSATTIVVNCHKMSGNKNKDATLSVNGASPQAAPESAGDLTFTVNDDIESIILSSVTAVQIYSITVNYSTGCTNGTITYSAGSTTYTGGNAISGSHANDTKVCSTNLTLPGTTFTTTGYTQDGWATTDGGSKVYNLGATNYSTEGNATLYPHWTIDTYNVHWKVNGNDWEGGTHGSPSTSANYNNKPATIPTAPVTGDCDGTKVFVGWTNSTYSHASTAPTILFTSQSSAPAITGNITFHAVFANAAGSDPVYTKVTSISEGTYIMVSECTSSTYRYMPNTTSSDANPTLGSGITMSTTAGVTTLTNSVTSDMLWDISTGETSGYYYVRPHGSTTEGLGTYSATGKNIRIGSDYVTEEWRFKTSASYGWEIDNGYYLAVYDDSSWRNYSDNSTNQNGTFYLFKQSGGMTYSNYATSCCTKLGSINGSISLTQGGNSVTISGWSDVANVGTYTVRMYKKNGASWDLVSGTTSGGSAGTQGTRTGITGASKSVTYTGLEVESEYKFTVQAIAGSASYCDGDETAVTEINRQW